MKKYRSRKMKRRLRKLNYICSAICVGVIFFGILYIIRMGMDYAREEEVEARIRAMYYAKQQEAASQSAGAEQADMNGELEVSNNEASTPQPVQTDAPQTSGNEELTGTDLATEVPSANPEGEQSNAGDDISAGDGTAGEGTAPEGDGVIAQEPVLQPEFEGLYEINPDVVGWIKVADCVDYPVVWRDNTYYMDHDFEGNESQAGSIFLDGRNQPDMLDSAILIYGHNMKNGTMFGNLDRYRGGDYLKKYPVFTLKSAWETEERKYVLISLFDASMNRSDPSYISIIRTSFEEPEAKEQFIAEMRAKSMFDIDIDACADDHLVTLVTCSYSHANGRFLLFARELREDETEEDIIEAFKTMNLR